MRNIPQYFIPHFLGAFGSREAAGEGIIISHSSLFFGQ